MALMGLKDLQETLVYQDPEVSQDREEIRVNVVSPVRVVLEFQENLVHLETLVNQVRQIFLYIITHRY